MFDFFGYLKKRKRSPKTAWHESGHVIVAQILLPGRRIRADIDQSDGGGIPADFIEGAATPQLYRIAVAGVLAEARGMAQKSIELAGLRDFATSLATNLRRGLITFPQEIPIEGGTIQTAGNTKDFFWLDDGDPDADAILEASEWVVPQLDARLAQLSELQKFLMAHGKYDSQTDPVFA